MIDAQRVKKFIGNSRRLKVLYIEDDVRLRENTVKLLSKFFDTIECAADGQDGFRKYRPGTHDIVISDIRMPSVNGMELVRQIKAINEDQTIIVTSAHGESEYFMELMNLGVNNFILKPVNVEKMLDTLEDAVNCVMNVV